MGICAGVLERLTYGELTMCIHTSFVPLAGMLASFALFGLPSGRAAAQGAPAHPELRNRTPVALVLVEDHASRSGEVVLLRRALEKPHDVILIPRNRLQARRIAEALDALQAARAERGLIPLVDGSYSVASMADGKRYKHADEAIGWVSDLKKAAPRNIPGIGNAPVIVLYLENALPLTPKK